MSRWIFLALAIGPSFLTGCGSRTEAGSVQLTAEGVRFLLPDEPAGAVGILEHREAVGATTAAPDAAETEPAPPTDVVLWGRIGGKKHTWSPESAEFVISDPTFALQAGDHACTDDNCPFCKSKHDASSAEAIVSLIDDQGHVPDVAARQLLPLEEGQMVVVRGEAEVNSLGLLVVRATGIYLRR